MFQSTSSTNKNQMLSSQQSLQINLSQQQQQQVQQQNTQQDCIFNQLTNHFDGCQNQNAQFKSTLASNFMNHESQLKRFDTQSSANRNLQKSKSSEQDHFFQTVGHLKQSQLDLMEPISSIIEQSDVSQFHRENLQTETANNQHLQTEDSVIQRQIDFLQYQKVMLPCDSPDPYDLDYVQHFSKFSLNNNQKSNQNLLQRVQQDEDSTMFHYVDEQSTLKLMKVKTKVYGSNQQMAKEIYISKGKRMMSYDSDSNIPLNKKLQKCHSQSTQMFKNIQTLHKPQLSSLTTSTPTNYTSSNNINQNITNNNNNNLMFSRINTALMSPTANKHQVNVISPTKIFDYIGASTKNMKEQQSQSKKCKTTKKISNLYGDHTFTQIDNDSQI
eukprot:403352041